jgi:TonB family protein
MAPSVNNMNNGRRLNDSGRRTKAYDSMPGAYATMDHLSGTLKKDTITNINVVLKPIALPPAEVVVLDKSSPRDKAAAMAKARPKVIIDTLEPDAGIARFDEYIATNIRTPDELKSKELSGEVQLSFEVNSEGVPTNITVVKSLCEKCDEEAIRLLKEGPKWKKKKNKKGKLTIKF